MKHQTEAIKSQLDDLRLQSAQSNQAIAVGAQQATDY